VCRWFFNVVFFPLTTHTLLVVVVGILFFYLPMRFLSLSLNQDGQSALHLAAEKGFVEVVTVLVAAKADLDLVTTTARKVATKFKRSE